MGEDNGIYGIDKLAELLIARGIEFYVMDEYSLLFVDGKGNLHECCRSGTKDLVNVMIVTTPEEALSVTDLNGVITDNAKLRELVRDLHKALFTLDIDHCQACPRDNINGPCTKFAVWGNDECSIEEDMRELGIEVEE